MMPAASAAIGLFTFSRFWSRPSLALLSVTVCTRVNASASCMMCTNTAVYIFRALYFSGLLFSLSPRLHRLFFFSIIVSGLVLPWSMAYWFGSDSVYLRFGPGVWRGGDAI
jgi:hypothetical protein